MKSRRRPWSAFVSGLLKHKFLIFTPLVVLAISIVTLAVLLNYKESPTVPSSLVGYFLKTIPEPQAIHYYEPLTGLEVDDEVKESTALTAVMIENSPEARPQSGLKDAGIVFEARAEGGITRFMAMYQNTMPDLIGPVRSVRSVFVDWLKPFNASIAHVGGNATALTLVRNGTYRDIDQFFNSSYYWRAGDRYAPHNVYTSAEKLRALNTAKDYTTSDFPSFERTDAAPVENPDASSINVKISSALFDSSYAYNADTNTYARSQGGAPHLDREGGQITPSVVVTLYVNESTVMEDGYREKIDVIGSGKGYVFQNGTVTEVTWKKSSRDAQVQFIDSDGTSVALVRGQTWIVAVPNGVGNVSWK